MLTCRKVAVTGAIASGKSSVCRSLRDLGAYTVDADAIVHRLLTPDTSLGQNVLQLLGPEIISGTKFDRSKIAKKVFTNHELLWKLEQLIHPEVQKEIASLYQQVRSSETYPLFVVEVPLLYEAGSQDFYDSVVVVCAEPEKSKQRFTERTEHDGKEFAKREARLIPLEKKKELADFIIENNSSLTALQKQVEALIPQLLPGKNKDEPAQ